MSEASEVIINDLVYHIEDEELPDVSYYEIITLDEMLKENPTFIAFSREEIFNELYDFFKNTNKSDALADLFYKDNTINITNYVFVADAEKPDIGCFDQDIEEFIKNMKAINRLPCKTAVVEKNKYYFALTYDTASQNIRLKPYMKTTVELQDKSTGINIFYPVSADDDTNIPIAAAYYKAPISCTDDYISQKVIHHLEKPMLFNLADSGAFSDINKLIRAVKPRMRAILEKFQVDADDFDVDYNGLNAILARFNTSLEEINVEDFALLKEHLQHVLEIKEYDIKYKKFKVQNMTIVNDKKEFYNKIHGITNLLSFSDKSKEDYHALVDKLQNDKFNVNAPGLLYNNINDIIRAVANNEVSIEEVIENLEANRKVLVLDHAINSLKNITQNDVERISTALEELTRKFKLLHNAVKDIFEFHFIELYEDIKEIKAGNDYSNYEGIPEVFKNAPNFEGAIDEDDGDEGIDIGVNRMHQLELEKYWLSIKYQNDTGFTEMLRVVVLMFSKIQGLAKLGINYECLCDVLYSDFAGVPTKFNILQTILQRHDVKLADDFIRDVVRITPNVALTSSANNLITEDIARYVQECNREYVAYLFDMIYTGLAWWSMQLQTDILNDTLIFDDNQYLYIDKWSLDGAPLKESKSGTLAYLSAITEDVMTEDVYTVAPKIAENSMKKIEGTFKDDIERLRTAFRGLDKKKQNKGTETYQRFVDTIKEIKQDKSKQSKLLNDYVNALIYMPSYKFQKIHKFLLGCCLQQIGKKFIVDSDIQSKHSKDFLTAAKNKYAKTRQTIRTKYPMFIPVAKHSKELEDDEDLLILPEEISVDAKRGIEDWFDSMQNKSPLLPNDKLDGFKNGTKSATDAATRYIEIFCKTSGNKNDEFKELFFKTNYLRILKIICTTFQKHPCDNENETLLLQNAINSINLIIKELENLNECIDEYNKQDIIRIREFVTARALCLPCNPDMAVNNILQPSINVSNAFMRTLSATLFMALIKYMRMVKMPTVEENIAFINEIREKNKKETLDIMNVKTKEERDLMNTLKKIGLKYEDEDDSGEKNKKGYEQEYGEDDLQEDEFRKTAEDDENDDNLDDDNYGFLYS